MNILLIDADVAECKEVMQSWAKWANLPVNWLFTAESCEAYELLSKGNIDLILVSGYVIDGSGSRFHGKDAVCTLRHDGIKTRICMFCIKDMHNQWGLMAHADFAIDKAKFMEGNATRESEQINQAAFAAMDQLAAIIQLALLERTLKGGEKDPA